MAAQGCLEEFDLVSPELWDTYVDLEFFLEANKISDAGLKWAILLSVCGSATVKITQNLMAPAELLETSYKDIMALLRNHFLPQLSRITCCHAFYKRDQAAGESIATYLATLCNLIEYPLTEEESLRNARYI